MAHTALRLYMVLALGLGPALNMWLGLPDMALFGAVMRISACSHGGFGRPQDCCRGQKEQGFLQHRCLLSLCPISVAFVN
ncbi:hypothetical protein [Kordiimonas marina]|uniref:hypothetical protein n=1 Tax=Kordiimonas marina TaxID=2872312 RepID=UPI001FF3E028|nr:hypothetical protein [Kordiimonas marina]